MVISARAVANRFTSSVSSELSKMKYSSEYLGRPPSLLSIPRRWTITFPLRAMALLA